MTELGVDYSFARPEPAAIKAAGYGFVIRYVCPASESAKAVSTSEAQALHAAGVAILICFEDGAKNALGGATQGAADGQIAKAAVQSLGYPTACPIFPAVDFDAQPVQLATIDAYLNAFAAAVAPWPSGDYGKMNVGDSEPDKPYWETEAWDGSAVDSHAVLYQRVRPTVANPVSGCDEDVLLQPVNMWTPSGPVPVPGPTPTPAPKPAPPAAPPFPLPAGQWYGPPSKDPRNHSGYYWPADRSGIRNYQAQMVHRGWRGIAVTGVFDPGTETVTRQFQTEKHLQVDGLVGPVTWRAAWEAPIT